MRKKKPAKKKLASRKKTVKRKRPSRRKKLVRPKAPGGGPAAQIHQGTGAETTPENNPRQGHDDDADSEYGGESESRLTAPLQTSAHHARRRGVWPRTEEFDTLLIGLDRAVRLAVAAS